MSVNFMKKFKMNQKNDIISHNFCKIMFLSCVYISDNKYELTYLLDYVYKNENAITLIPIKKIISYEEYLKVKNTRFGVWFRNNNIFDFTYLYIYHNMNNNRLVYKTTNNDNYLSENTINQYSHKLIFKALLKRNSNVLEEFIN